MTVRTNAKRTIPGVKWLCVLSLFGCDDPDVELAADDEQGQRREAEA